MFHHLTASRFDLSAFNRNDDFQRRSICTACLLLPLILSWGGTVPALAGAAEAPAAAKLDGIHRIVMLGDSITQDGNYIADMECWLLSRGFKVEVLNLGLGSETASDLTEAENAGHAKKYGFGHPRVSERLARVLAETKPDMLFVCYGMNDCGSLPANETGTKRYAEAVTRLRDTALKSGVKRVIFATPSVHEAKHGQWEKDTADQNLTRYTNYLLSKKKDGWDVVDIHTPMRQALDAARAKDPKFAFCKDSVHPGREGHWLMASCLLTQYFGADLKGVSSAEGFFPKNGAEIRKLALERQKVLFDALMTKIGHTRPGVPGGPKVKKGPSVEEATAKAAEISKKIEALLSGGK